MVAGQVYMAYLPLASGLVEIVLLNAGWDMVRCAVATGYCAETDLVWHTLLGGKEGQIATVCWYDMHSRFYLLYERHLLLEHPV